MHPLIYNRINLDVGLHASASVSVELLCLAPWTVLDLVRQTLPECGFVDLAFVSWPTPFASVGPYRGNVVSHVFFAWLLVFVDLHATFGVQHLHVYVGKHVFYACSLSVGLDPYLMIKTRANPLPQMKQCELHHEGKSRAYPLVIAPNEMTRMPACHNYKMSGQDEESPHSKT